MPTSALHEWTYAVRANLLALAGLTALAGGLVLFALRPCLPIPSAAPGLTLAWIGAIAFCCTGWGGPTMEWARKARRALATPNSGSLAALQRAGTAWYCHRVGIRLAARKAKDETRLDSITRSFWLTPIGPVASSSMFPRLLNFFIRFLREAGWTVNPPENNDFYVAATIGLRDRSPEGQSAALATITDFLVRERMRAALNSPTDPKDYAVASFISFLATPMGENAVFEASKGEGIERFTTTMLETIQAHKTDPRKQ